MEPITDDYMRARLSETKPYTIVVLHRTKKALEPGSDRVIWEHGRRNFEMKRARLLLVVCPVRDESDVSGVGIFSTDLAGTKKLMDEDPGVKAGIFSYEMHPTRSFPGDSLT